MAVEIERLRAENKRLRAALESIRLHADGQVSQYARARETVLSIALSALGPPEEPHPGTRCPRCHGTGGGVYNDCPTCGGNGDV